MGEVIPPGGHCEEEGDGQPLERQRWVFLLTHFLKAATFPMHQTKTKTKKKAATHRHLSKS